MTYFNYHFRLNSAFYSETCELKVDFESNRTQSNQFDFVTANRTELFRIFKLLNCFDPVRSNRTELITKKSKK